MLRFEEEQRITWEEIFAHRIMVEDISSIAIANPPPPPSTTNA
jgi:hypothetical protein